MNDHTREQLDEIDAIESTAGSYGRLVMFAFDPDLTDHQRQHCRNVMRVGHTRYGVELRAKYGEQYPLEALALRIDHDIERMKPAQETRS